MTQIDVSRETMKIKLKDSLKRVITPFLGNDERKIKINRNRKK